MIHFKIYKVYKENHNTHPCKQDLYDIVKTNQNSVEAKKPSEKDMGEDAFLKAQMKECHWINPDFCHILSYPCISKAESSLSQYEDP